MPRDDPYEAAFKAAAAATRAVIRAHRAKAPRVLKKLFTVISCNLFHPSLNATWALKEAEIKDRAIWTVFHDTVMTSLGHYITKRRIQAGHVLMMTTDLSLGVIAERIGFIHYPTFLDAYRRVKGRKPSEVPREKLPNPLIDDETSLKGGRALLDDDAAEQYLEDLHRIYPEAAKRLGVGTATAAPEPRIVVDGARGDRLEAEDLWRKIRDLPFEDQCQRVRGYLFRSTVLFDLLREKSRLEGRKKRQRGVELAELALVSLEEGDEAFGERIHDLRALGWAWLGNAHRLALDFSAASAAFEQADREWAVPRTKLDISVLANICLRKGALSTVRREYANATRDLDRACELFQQEDERRDEARALIQRATTHIYAGKLDKAVADLREAEGLTDDDEEKELAFAIRGNLANALARAGEVKRAAEELERARQLYSAIDDPLGAPKLDCIAGLISENQGDLEAAKNSYQAALERFCNPSKLRYYGIVSVDLMVVHSRQDDWESVGVLAAKTLPILDSMSLHHETLAAVRLLAQALEAENLSRRLLSELREALRRDPLTSM